MQNSKPISYSGFVLNVDSKPFEAFEKIIINNHPVPSNNFVVEEQSHASK